MRLAPSFIARAALAITLCWVAVLALTGATDALLFFAPALLIAIPLLSGRYLGEELIAKLATRLRRGRRHPRPASHPAPHRPARRLPRGRRLIAFSLATRPPPAGLLEQT